MKVGTAWTIHHVLIFPMITYWYRLLALLRLRNRDGTLDTTRVERGNTLVLGIKNIVSRRFVRSAYP